MLQERRSPSTLSGRRFVFVCCVVPRILFSYYFYSYWKQDPLIWVFGYFYYFIMVKKKVVSCVKTAVQFQRKSWSNVQPKWHAWIGFLGKLYKKLAISEFSISLVSFPCLSVRHLAKHIHEIWRTYSSCSSLQELPETFYIFQFCPSPQFWCFKVGNTE